MNIQVPDKYKSADAVLSYLDADQLVGSSIGFSGSVGSAFKLEVDSGDASTPTVLYIYGHMSPPEFVTTDVNGTGNWSAPSTAVPNSEEVRTT